MKKIFFIYTLLISTSLYASIGAVTSATGGTGRGAIEPIDGVLLNPATISDMPSKTFSYNYSNNEWALSVTDNGRDALIPAALIFVKTTNNNVDTQQLGLSLASRRWHKFTLAATGSMMEYTNHLSPSSEEKYRQAVFDLSGTYALATNFGFGIVANKVGSNPISLAENLQTQQTVAMGMGYTYQDFARLRFDVETAPENKTDRLVYMLGLENYINQWMIFRIGYQNNNVLSKNYFSAGMGFSGPQFGLHYAYIANTADNSEDKHCIDLGFPF